MGAVSEWPDNGLSVQASTPTQDFLAYATKKIQSDLPATQRIKQTLVFPQKEGHDGKTCCWGHLVGCKKKVDKEKNGQNQ